MPARSPVYFRLLFPCHTRQPTSAPTRTRPRIAAPPPASTSNDSNTTIAAVVVVFFVVLGAVLAAVLWRRRRKTKRRALEERHRGDRLAALPVHALVVAGDLRPGHRDVDTLLALLLQPKHRVSALDKDFDGQAAAALALDRARTASVDARVLTQLLLNSLPFEPSTHAAVPAEAHDYAWLAAVQSDAFAPAVEAVLAELPDHAHALSTAADAGGRIARDLASPANKRIFLQARGKKRRTLTYVVLRSTSKYTSKYFKYFKSTSKVLRSACCTLPWA